MRRLFLKAWLMCGTLGIIYAAVMAQVLGRSPLAMLRTIASGPFGDAALDWGPAGSVLGLATHFAIMTAIVAAEFWLARKTPLGDVAPWKAGTLFGLVFYGVMYGAVMQWRFGLPFPDRDKMKLALDLFPHVFLVGIPLFYLLSKAPRPS